MPGVHLSFKDPGRADLYMALYAPFGYIAADSDPGSWPRTDPRRPGPTQGVRTAMPHPQFHVFLSHNSADKPAVEELARRLKAEGMEPWLD